MKLQELLAKQLQDEEFAKLWFESKSSFEASLLVLRLRALHNLTQAELAEKVGIKRSYIARIESGTANPTVQTLGKILAAFDQFLVLGFEPRKEETIPASTLSVSQNEEEIPSVRVNYPNEVLSGAQGY